MMTTLTAPRTAPRPGSIRTGLPSTDTGDMTLRLCRAERRIEALVAAVRLLCGEDLAPERRRAAALIFLDDVRL